MLLTPHTFYSDLIMSSSLSKKVSSCFANQFSIPFLQHLEYELQLKQCSLMHIFKHETSLALKVQSTSSPLVVVLFLAQGNVSGFTHDDNSIKKLCVQGFAD